MVYAVRGQNGRKMGKGVYVEETIQGPKKQKQRKSKGQHLENTMNHFKDYKPVLGFVGEAGFWSMPMPLRQ